MYTKEIEKLKQDVLNNMIDIVTIDNSIILNHSSKDFFPVEIFYNAIQQSFLNEFQLNISGFTNTLDSFSQSIAQKMNMHYIKFVFKKLDDYTIYIADINTLDLNEAINSVTLRFEENNGEIMFYQLDSDFENMNKWINKNSNMLRGNNIANLNIEDIEKKGINFGDYTMLIMMSYILDALNAINTLSKNKVLKEPKRKYVNIPSNKKGKSKNKGAKKAKIISSYYITQEDLENKDFKRDYNKIMESWTVKGHTRTYKNGKTVWIAPYTKGNGEKTPKEYEL